MYMHAYNYVNLVIQYWAVPLIKLRAYSTTPFKFITDATMYIFHATQLTYTCTRETINKVSLHGAVFAY